MPERLLFALSLLLAGCSGGGEVFVEAAADSGLDFQHFNGMSGELYFAEMMGSGVGLIDYDNDGDLDVYMVQGEMLGPDKTVADALFPPQSPPGDRLFRNDIDSGVLRFTDVTGSSGLDAGGYGMGVACGDIDNDGYVDLYVTNFGHNRILRNRGDGRFEEISQGGVDDVQRWSVSAAFLDYDRDGWLDLYVGHYVDFHFFNHKPCRSSTSARDYCSPLVYQPQRDSLYRNQAGQFTDVSTTAGIDQVFGGALGISVADFDGDDWLDIYVANDGVPNQLWHNNRNGTFEDRAPLSGVAVNMDGRPEASMGVDAGDFDGDGDEDLFMTHLSRESNTLYVNDGRGWFEDRSLQFGLAGSSLSFTGFGTAWLDFDNDSDLDLLSVNGAVTQIQALVDRGDRYPLHQRNQLFENTGNGVFADISSQAGVAMSASAVSRGAAFGDLDNDGDTDVIISNNNGPTSLLLNQLGNRNGWLGLRLLTADGMRDALGARVTLLHNGQPIAAQRAGSDGSYASCNDPRVLFGLGASSGEFAANVTWPDGSKETVTGLATGRYTELRQGPAGP